MPRPTTLKGKIVIEYLDKWPDLPTLTLAKLIYNRDDNNKVFNNIEHIRDFIRYYRGTHGDSKRRKISIKRHLQ